MKFKSTIILAVIFIGLFAYVYLYEVIGEREKKEAEEEAKKLINIKGQDYYTIVIERPDVKITFQKERDVWWIDTPIKYRADDSNVSSLTYYIGNAKNDGEVAETGKDSVSYGLGPPRMKLYVLDQKSIIDSLLIGDKSPVGNHVFARQSNTGRIFLTDYYLSEQMEKDLSYYRNKRVLEFQRGDASRMVFTFPNQTIEMKRLAYNEWEIEKPIKTRAEYSVITELLDRFSTSDVEKFIDENPKNLKKYGLDIPMVRLNIYVEKDASERSLIVGSKVRKEDADEGKVLYYAKNEVFTPVIAIDSSLVNKINTNLFILRDKMVVDFIRSQIGKVMFDYKDSVFVCFRDTTKGWFFDLDMQIPANADRIDEIINEFIAMRAVEFFDYNEKEFPKYGLDKPDAEFVFYSTNGEEIERLVFGNIRGDKLFIANKTKKGIYLVNSDYYYDLKIRKSELIKQQEEEENKK